MAKTKMQAGAEIETVTPQELQTHLDRYTKDWYQEKARGVVAFRFEGIGTVDSTNLTIPAVGDPDIGPRKGYAWTVQSVRISGLSMSDSVSVYRNSAVPSNFVGLLTTAAPIEHFGSKGLILRGDEKLLFIGSSLSATGDVVVNGEGIEVPEPDLYKVL